ncbi:MAG TPA: hypothetical protein VFA90_19540 [Terriglobales bacterium]|nr:hypothetical protein [Terriglobales bacterium]
MSGKLPNAFRCSSRKRKTVVLVMKLLAGCAPPFFLGGAFISVTQGCIDFIIQLT